MKLFLIRISAALGALVFTAGQGSDSTSLGLPRLVWTIVPSGTTETVESVWGSSATDIWAVGTAGTILHYDGAKCSSVQSGTDLPLYAVWGSSASDVWAVGATRDDPGTPRTALHFNGTTWTSVPAGITGILVWKRRLELN